MRSNKENPQELLDHVDRPIRRVLAGKVWLSEAMAERLLQRSAGTGQKLDWDDDTKLTHYATQWVLKND